MALFTKLVGNISIRIATSFVVISITAGWIPRSLRRKSYARSESSFPTASEFQARPELTPDYDSGVKSRDDFGIAMCCFPVVARGINFSRSPPSAENDHH